MQQDFLVTVTFSLMWLLSSCCWAKTLTDIKTATNPTEVLLLIAACREKENRCAATQEPLWSRLNTSTVGIYSKLMQSFDNNNPLTPVIFFPGFWIC